MKISVETDLIKKADQVRNTAALIMQQTSDWQIIKEYLCNRLEELQLTPQQKAKLDRYQFIYNQQVCGRYSTQQIVNMLRSTYGIQKTQAYEDIRNTKEIFASVININRAFEINVQLEINRQMIAEARANRDYRSASSLERNRASLLAMLPEDDERPADLFTGHTIQAIFDPRLLGAPDVDLHEVLKIINEKRDVKLRLDQITSLPFEEVVDESPL